MFASKKRIKLYNEIKKVKEEISLMEKSNEVDKEKKAKLLSKYVYMVKNLIFSSKLNGDDKLCDHIFTKNNDGTYTCVNCNEKFVEKGSAIYKVSDVNKKIPTNYKGIPVINSSEADSYLKLLYLRACALMEPTTSAINLRIIEENMLKLIDEDKKYQKYIDEEFEKDNDKDLLMKRDFEKKFGLY